mmetsp:Transcript_7465/g.19906  ORF Transcript_7465/g.19906 Transcript_7465/m.19906 type:complete len:237 (-) Transcript_7465:140-850(-)
MTQTSLACLLAAPRIYEHATCCNLVAIWTVHHNKDAHGRSTLPVSCFHCSNTTLTMLAREIRPISLPPSSTTGNLRIFLVSKIEVASLMFVLPRTVIGCTVITSCTFLPVPLCSVTCTVLKACHVSSVGGNKSPLLCPACKASISKSLTTPTTRLSSSTTGMPVIRLLTSFSKHVVMLSSGETVMIAGLLVITSDTLSTISLGGACPVAWAEAFTLRPAGCTRGWCRRAPCRTHSR